MEDTDTNQYDTAEETMPLGQKNLFRKILKLFGFLTAFAVFFTVLLGWYFSYLNNAPDSFPINQSIEIVPGTEIKTIVETLENENVVRSSSFLYYLLALLHDPTDVKASVYIFSEPLTTTEVAERLTEGDFNTNLIRFTHFEGERVTLIAERASKLLPNFDAERFVKEAEPLEGKLFPETYFIPKEYTDEELLQIMRETFEEKTFALQADIEASELSLDEIIILASIIEREANNPESMRLVSSVLQNRLEIGMALQADASIEYVLKKPLSELTPEDLDVDSPYNTYLYPGLPPTPIGNPGLDAIKAVLHPAETDYFYYITDEEGIFHYSKNYSGHLRNIETYLR